VHTYKARCISFNLTVKTQIAVVSIMIISNWRLHGKVDEKQLTEVQLNIKDAVVTWAKAEKLNLKFAIQLS
jgi:hypothetical protein